jgi:hypothetical protein
LACSRTRASPPRALPPSHWRNVLTRQPPSLSRAHSLLAVWPRLSAVSSSSRHPFIAVTSGHRLPPLLRLLAAQGSLAPLRPPPPLTSVLAGTASPWCPLGGAVRHLWPALCSSPEPRSSTAPFPRAPIKGPPRAPPSPHQPRPSFPSLVRAQFVEAPPPSSSSPVSRPSLLPAPLLIHQAIA